MVEILVLIAAVITLVREAISFVVLIVTLLSHFAQRDRCS
jgi:hypothetical protein